MRLFVRKHFAAYLFVEAILMLGIAVRYSMAFIWRKRLVFLTFVLDVIVFDYALYFAEQIIKHESHWNGFPEFAVPVIYTVPVLLHTGIGAIIGQFKKDTISVGLSLLASVCSFLMLTSLTYFFKEFGYSRAVVLLTYIIASLGFIVWRLIAKFKLKLDNPFRAGARRVLVVGASDSAKAIAERLLSKRTEYYQLMGFIASDMRDVGSIRNTPRVDRMAPNHTLLPTRMPRKARSDTTASTGMKLTIRELSEAVSSATPWFSPKKYMVTPVNPPRAMR